MFKQNKAKTVTIVKAKETKQRFRLNGSQRLKEGGFILGLLVAILMMVSLFSFDPADPSWSQTAWGGIVHNAGGYIGAWIADTLFFTFGSFAYPLPFIILGASWAFFRSRDEDESIDLLLWGTRLLGLVVMLLTSCGLADINFDDIWYFSSGGVVGDVLTSLAMPALNNLGSTLVFMFLWGAGFTLLTGISWLTIVENLGRGSLRICQRLFNRARGEETAVVSSAGFQKKELASLKFDDVEEQDLSLQLGAIDDVNEDDVAELPEQKEKKSPRFNIHFPRKVSKKQQSAHQEPVMSASHSIEPTDEELNDPLFSAPSSSTPVTNVTFSEHSHVPIQSQNRYQNPNATIAELDQQAEMEGDFVPQESVSQTSAAQNSATQAPATRPNTYQQNASVVPSAFEQETMAPIEAPTQVSTPFSAKPLTDDPLISDPAVSEELTTNSQPISTEHLDVDDDSNIPSFGTMDVELDTESTVLFNTSIVDPVANNQPTVNSDASAPMFSSAASEPASVTQDTSEVNSLEEGVSRTEPEMPNDADAAAFQNIVAAAQAKKMASQNPFLIQSDHNLPVPTSPMPTLELLYHPEKRESHIDRDALENIARLVESKLADYKIEARVVDIFPGPVITRFELDLAPGVKVSRISGLSMDLARSLSAMAVRVVEVIPGKPYVGLELPNMSRETVYLSDVINSEQFQNNKSPTAVVLGQDIAGEAVVADLAKMPHVLVAGTTGSGKSVGVNVMILSILYKATPEDVRFIMIDPKMLELSIYEGIPHLLSEVVTDMKDASNALRWCVGEMERRYKLLSAVGVRNLKGYNEKLKMAAAAGHPIHDPLWKPGDSMDEMPPLLEKLPSIVVIVDEFADLIMVVGKKVEELIARLAQKARAAGIHLVLATQRPSVDVITGLIKANIPARVAFTVSTKTDSRTILDQGGAESLLGMGDMLYLPPGSNHTVRVHGAFASDDDVHAVVNDWKARGRPVYIDEIIHGEPTAESLLPGEQLEGEEEMDPLYDQVVEFVTDSRRGSVSGVQRRFKIGYNRAARIVEQLEVQGIVSSPGHNGNREVIAPPPVKQFD
ncbi:DNA translocase FtsK [Vibrio sp. S17_S38]|uniref:DNA translocase FtsK 4TM domain-containing protein n=1 Tax=Vibrio sp. S17_S38 TaxID=2720229 RepID=UPI0016815FAD|nr:DNA translocase FtsK [Vibrio sp. S17_S38]